MSTSEPHNLESRALASTKSSMGSLRQVLLLQRSDVTGGTKKIIDDLQQRLEAEGIPARALYLRSREGLDSARKSRLVRLAQAGAHSLEVLRKVLFSRPPVIVTFTPLLGALTAIAALPFRNVRVVATQHNNSSMLPWIARKLDLVAGRIGAYHRVISCAHSVAESFVGNGQAYMSLITVIPNGVKSNYSPRKAGKDAPLRATLGVPEQNQIAFAAGRLSWVKNHEIILSALVELPNWSFVIAGAGAVEGELRSKVTELGLTERVHFLGVQPVERVSELLSQCDAFVLPSFHEGLSLSLLEAMAHGAPCIASDIPSNREVLGGGGLGWLLSSEKPDEWVDALRKLTKNPALGEEMGRAAREYQRANHDEDKMYEQYVSVITEALE